VFIVANEANVSMLRDEKIRVVERQWIVPSPLSVPAVYQSLAASLATRSGWRNQAVTLGTPAPGILSAIEIFHQLTL
jgi:hypothetical protein